MNNQSTQDYRKSFAYRREYLKRSTAIGNYFVCSICGKLVLKDDLHVDHIIPLAKGGKNRWLNTVATCSSCNNKKGSDLTYTYLVKGFISKGIEILIILIKRFLNLVFYWTYNILRSLVLTIIFPLRCKIHWIFKIAYIVMIIKMGGV